MAIILKDKDIFNYEGKARTPFLSLNMKAEVQNETNFLVQNRNKFLQFNQFKVDRTLRTLAEKDRSIFLIIPRLLHVHQPGLPGYFEGDVPCGISNFNLTHESRLALEKWFPRMIVRRNPNLDPVIHTLLLMGSLGSIAQTHKSDLDYTLLVDGEKLPPERMKLFQKKLRLIEEWTWQKHHLETHFFVNDTRDFKNNIFGESDSESTGSALAKLLKEEMFRTMIVLTGKIPLWWVLPVETDDAKYDDLLDLVNSRQTLLNREDFIDVGNVDDISHGEFFGGSIWALIKSFKSPFKTLMKMGLLETYMFSHTKSNLLCHEIKKNVFAGKPYLDNDPYLLLFKRVQDYFKNSKSDVEINALRTAFYLKVGTQISANDLKEGSGEEKKSILLNMIKEWEWNSHKLKSLNAYDDWQMMKKVELGTQINKILMTSYKNISEKNKTLEAGENLITEKDTHLLGRKLFSFYRKTPHKVENLFSLVDGKTAESELTFLFVSDKDPNKKGWYLVRGKTLVQLEQIGPENLIKKSPTLHFLIAFTAFNKLYNKETHVLIRSEGQSIKEHDLKVLLSQLTAFFAEVNIAALSNQDLCSNAKIKKIYFNLDFGIPLPQEIILGSISECKNNDELNRFIQKRVEKIQNLTVIYLTSWGELFCKTYSGLNCLDRSLKELIPHIDPYQTQKLNFIKIYIPSGRKEILQLPWLNNYLIRSLKSKTKANEDAAEYRQHAAL